MSIHNQCTCFCLKNKHVFVFVVLKRMYQCLQLFICCLNYRCVLWLFVCWIDHYFLHLHGSVLRSSLTFKFQLDQLKILFTVLIWSYLLFLHVLIGQFNKYLKYWNLIILLFKQFISWSSKLISFWNCSMFKNWTKSKTFKLFKNMIKLEMLINVLNIQHNHVLKRDHQQNINTLKFQIDHGLNVFNIYIYTHISYTWSLCCSIVPFLLWTWF